MDDLDFDISYNTEHVFKCYHGYEPVLTVTFSPKPHWSPQKIHNDWRDKVTLAHTTRLVYQEDLEQRELLKTIKYDVINPGLNRFSQSYFSVERQVPRDMKFKTPYRRFKVHRLLFETLSDVFRAMLKFHSQQTVIKLHSFESLLLPGKDLMRHFNQIIYYAYNGNVRLNSKNVKPLLILADYFWIDQLKDRCVDYLIVYLTPRSVFHALHLAQMLRLPKLKSMALKYFSRHLLKTTENPDYPNMDPESLIQAFDADDLIVLRSRFEPLNTMEREYSLFAAVLKYLSARCPDDTGIALRLVATVRLLDLYPRRVQTMLSRYGNLASNPVVAYYVRHAAELWSLPGRGIDTHLIAETPAAWSRHRLMARCGVLHHTISVGRPAEFVVGPFLEDSMEIESIEVAIRDYAGYHVIAGLTVVYRDHHTKVYMLTDSEGIDLPLVARYKVMLALDERIVQVFYAVARPFFQRIGFITSFDNQFGPFGGKLGGTVVIEPCFWGLAYLHDLHFVTQQDAYGERFLTTLALQWARFC